MSQEKLLEARNLIENKHFDQAAAILQTMPDDPQARQWLGVLREKGLTPSRDLTYEQLVAKRGAMRAADYVALGAVVAAAIAAFWIYRYLNHTSIGGLYTLWEFVTGSETGSEAFLSTETLFVVVTRFLLAFGFTWAPCTAVIYTVHYISKNIRG